MNEKRTNRTESEPTDAQTTPLAVTCVRSTRATGAAPGRVSYLTGMLATLNN